jgi:hypothetical protein
MKDSHGAVAKRSGGEGAAIQVICLVSAKTHLCLSRRSILELALMYPPVRPLLASSTCVLNAVGTDAKRSRVP